MRKAGYARQAIYGIVLLLCLIFAVPAVAGEQAGRVSLDLKGAEISEVFRALAELGNMNIVLDPAVRGTLTIRLKDLGIDEALKLVAYTTGVEYRIVGSSLIVTPPGAAAGGFEKVLLEKFALTYAKTADVVPALELSVGTGKIQPDARSNSIVARGSAADMQSIRQIIAMLDVPVGPPPEAIVPAEPAPAPKPEARPSLRVFRLQHSDPASAKTALGLALPTGTVGIDVRTNSVLVVAGPEQLAQAAEIIAAIDIPVPEKLDSQEAIAKAQAEAALAAALQQAPAPRLESLEVVKLKYAPADAVAGLLSILVSRDKMQADGRTNTLVMLLDEASRERALQIIAQVDAAPPDAAVGVSAPTAEAAFAASGRHEADATVTQPQAAPAAEAVKVIRLAWAEADKARTALSIVLDQTRVSVDQRTNSLILRASPDEIARVQEVVSLIDIPMAPKESAEAKAPAEPQASPPARSLRVFRLAYAEPNSVRSALSLVMSPDGAQADQKTGSLLVFGTPDELALASEIVAAMDIEAPPVEALEKTESAQSAKPSSEPETAEVVRLAYALPSKVREALLPMLPLAKVSVDERTSSVVIMGTSSQRDQARRIIAELDAYVPAVEKQPVMKAEVAPEPQKTAAPESLAPAKVLQALRLVNADALAVKEALSLVLPVGAVQADVRTNSVLVYATEEELSRAKEMVAFVDAPALAETEPVAAAPSLVPSPASPVRTVRVFRLAEADPVSVKSALGLVISPDSIQADARTNSVLVVGVPDDLARAAEIVALLDVAAPKAPEPIPALQVQEKQAAPTPREPEPEIAEVVKLSYAQPARVREALAPTMPASKLSIDERTGSIVIVGTSAQREQAKMVIRELDVEVASPIQGEHEPAVKDAPEALLQQPAQAADPEALQVIKLAYAPAAKVREALAPIIPGDSITVDERTNSLVFATTQSKLAKAMQVIGKLDVEVAMPTPEPIAVPPAQPEPAEVVAYRMANASAESIRAAVGLLAPAADVQVELRTNTLLVKAAPSVHARVRELVASLDISVSAPPTPELPAPPPDVMRVFRLAHASASEIRTALGLVVPSGKVQADDRTKSLIVMAPEAAMTDVESVVKSLDVPSVNAAEPDPVVTRVYRLNYAVPADVKSGLASFIKGDITSDSRTSSVIVRASESEQGRAVQLIEAFDQELPQVLIEARLEEINVDAAQKLGLDWSFSGIKFGENALGEWASVSLDFMTNLTALEESGAATLISRQHTFTVDGKMGKILIGDRIPVIVQEVQEGQAVNTVQFIDAGIELSITPKVSDDGMITTTVKPVISSIVGWTPQNYPQIRTRELETVVSVKSGETAVIGGLVHRDEIQSLAKVPILGDLPIFGEFFKKRTTTSKNTEIVMLITAWQIRPGQRPTLSAPVANDKFPVVVMGAPIGK
ncbi:MAG: secretin N-terminal domain-containing protein [Clostridia bacterium]|nr:secretin N-terminal domain-containing protein [Clostridia bacterium]